MWTDPIVAEVRKQRERYAKKFGYDLDRIFADLKKSEKERLASESRTNSAAKSSRVRKVKSAAKITAKSSTRPSRRRKAA